MDKRTVKVNALEDLAEVALATLKSALRDFSDEYPLTLDDMRSSRVAAGIGDETETSARVSYYEAKYPRVLTWDETKERIITFLAGHYMVVPNSAGDPGRESSLPLDRSFEREQG